MTREFTSPLFPKGFDDQGGSPWMVVQQFECGTQSFSYSDSREGVEAEATAMAASMAKCGAGAVVAQETWAVSLHTIKRGKFGTFNRYWRA